MNGPDAIRIAFEAVGSMSFQEMMLNPTVKAGLRGFAKDLDVDKIKAAAVQ